jgi:hypothetical protein
MAELRDIKAAARRPGQGQRDTASAICKIMDSKREL